ncbi:MAG: STAS domain-containing protein [Spirochaetes bacterium]|nr:STAS domain-containing protein [Spirochaetota bacterium]
MIQIDAEEFGRVIIIHVAGILTRETIREAEEAWDEELGRHPDVIALDFKNLAQIDSVSINHIFRLSRRMDEINIRLVIIDLSEPLKKIFEVVKLDRVVRIIPKNKFEAEFLK